MYEIGARIKCFRERIGLTQKEFAQKINQQNSTVSNWERGLTRPNVDVLSDICTALDVSPNELLGIHLSLDDMTRHEHKIISAYHAKPEMQPAIDRLLGLEETTQVLKKPPLKIVAKGGGLKTIPQIEENED